MNNILKSLLRLNSDFDVVFFKNEFNALLGKRLTTILWLSLILLFTFLALGFAIGSIDNLRVKMDNPYTNWVNIPVDASAGNKVGKVIERYEDPEIADKFNLQGMFSYGRKALEFYHTSYNILEHPKDTLKSLAFGRTMDASEPIFKSILNEKSGNVVWVDPEFANKEELAFSGCEIIIAESLMDRLSFNAPEKTGYILVEDDERYFLKIVAVLRELPGKNEFVLSPMLYNIQEAMGNCRTQALNSNRDGKNYFNIFIENKDIIPALQKDAQAFLETTSTPDIEVEQEFHTLEKSYMLAKIYFSHSNTPPIDRVKVFIQEARKRYAVAEASFIECGGEICANLDLAGTYYMAFQFDELINIRKFKEDILRAFEIELDMNKVESKENFALVSRLTLTIASMLLAFSIISIVLFVNNLLQTHLQKVKPNLGTFQAFGLSNKFLIGAYIKIILSFLIIAISIAFGISLIIGGIEQLILGEDSYFNIFSSYLVFAIIGITLISVTLSTFSIKKILEDTPGNLIYGR